MAWDSLNTLGSAQNKTSGTTVVITTTAIAQVGNVIIVGVAFDNVFTGSANITETTDLSVTDSAGNTYTRAKEAQHGLTAGGKAGAAIFFSKVTTELASGGTITVTHPTLTARAANAWEFSIGAGNVVTVAGSDMNATNNADPEAMTIGSLANQEYLFVAISAGEAPNTLSYTIDADYTTFTTNGTTGGAAATNMSIRGGFQIFTGTTDTFDAAGGAIDWAQVYVALKEAAPPSFTPSPYLMLLGVGS